MDIGVVTAPLVAVVGVVGTLLSALLTQRAADRSRRQERQRAERARERRAEARELWSCYVALNASGRRYLAALTDQLYALGDTAEAPRVRQRLTDARDHHREAYAEAQIRLPERVLDRASAVSHGLGAVYGMIRRLDDGVPRPEDSPDAAHEDIEALWARLREMRREMRAGPGAARAGSARRRGDAGEAGAASAADRHSGSDPTVTAEGCVGPEEAGCR
ncbi:hypothetical protein AF335_18215 [Streptomyces eurocidicus]|uniref:Uncharacterized protein n=1 Tax=Streptomyces eurocidicus TaxID=66423 RepID=A0A2N8NUQ5_STREU|nr:hypothetical protein [Streptomyces eurocidicus]MBB5121293.1 hypothetical protein [Streptomyces eurocidicus]MBF6055899.1 hypothetical protein [Streptomyces eurocidicus]PNE32507.1 hypothetical protein AF335_18215 [Streptomyces eurocidicus]